MQPLEIAIRTKKLLASVWEGMSKLCFFEDLIMKQLGEQMARRGLCRHETLLAFRERVPNIGNIGVMWKLETKYRFRGLLTPGVVDIFVPPAIGQGLALSSA